MLHELGTHQRFLYAIQIVALCGVLSSCSSRRPIVLLNVTATPPLAIIGVPGSEVDPDQYIAFHVEAQNTSGFHSIAIRLTNVSDYRVLFDYYEPAFIFFRAHPGAEWTPVADQLANANQSAPLSLSPLRDADGMDISKVILNLDVPDPIPADAQARVIFVGNVIDEQGVGHRLVNSVDIDSTMFGWSPPNSSLVLMNAETPIPP